MVRRPHLPFAVVLAVILALPGFVFAFTLLGGSLGVGTTGVGFQRDVRVLDNCADPSAHANTTVDPLHPGAIGARLALWKAAQAWASDNPLAAKNFDFDWQSSSPSNQPDQNVVGWDVAGCSGGTLAFTETPIIDGWRIIMCDNWVWSDNPAGPGPGQWDITGIAAHELGHALGLGHSTVNCGSCGNSATMCAYICSNGAAERTIEADDAAGLQAIYGTIPTNKPVITGLSGSFNTGGVLLITGQNFTPTVVVKFSANTGNDVPPIPGIVTSVPSLSGGTQIAVTIPYAAVDGNVLVWEPGLGLTSNSYPIDVTFVPQPAPSVSSLAPTTVPAFGAGAVTLTGSGFTGTTAIQVNGVNVPGPLAFTLVNDTTLTFYPPVATVLGATSVVVVSSHGNSNTVSLTYVETSPPHLVAQSLTYAGLNFAPTFGGGANDTWIVVASLSPATIPFSGYQVLANFLPLFSGTLSTVGLGASSVTIPTGLGGTVFNLQVGTVDDLTGNFAASNITTTTILF